MNLKARMKSIDENSRIVIRNTVAAFFIKGGSLGLSLLTAPAFLRYFSDDAVLGVWYTLLSVLFWFMNFDLGIGNGIRNNLVKDLSAKDYKSAKKTLSSGLFATAVVTILLTVIGVLLILGADLNSLFNVAEDIISYEILIKSTLIVFIGIMVRFFLSSISSTFYALQMSSVNDFLALCVSLLQLLLVIVVRPRNAEEGLLILAIGYAFLSNVPAITAGILLFATKLRACRPSVRYIDRQHIRKVMGIGTVFFICQITYMLLMNTNEFLISRLFGPQYTTEYTFYYKLTSLISMAASLVLTPMWSVITKAMTENQSAWVVKLFRKLQIGGACSAVVQFLFVFILQFAMDFWLGRGTVEVKYSAAIAFACFGSLFVYCSILSTIVCGMARMRLQMICYSIGVPVKFGVIYTMAPIVRDWTIVVWGNVLVLLLYCIVQHIDLERYFRRLEMKNLQTPAQSL